jgi:mono/diheme cytochrome c family protein
MTMTSQTARTILALVACALAHAARAEDAESIERGRAMVTERCARCHAIDKSSASPHKSAPPFWTLGARYPIEDLEEAFAEGIVVGHPDMPNFEFSASEINDILAFLESLQPER